MTKCGNYSPRTHGPLAYNFQPIGNEYPGVYGMLPQKKKKQKTMPARNTSPALFVGIALCVVLIYLSLMMRASLVSISEEARLLENKINELYEQQTGLKLRHAEVFSLEETESYAVEVLGMKKPGLDQIRYVDFPDVYEAAQTDENISGWNILSILKEYFSG